MIDVQKTEQFLILTLNRPEQKNAITFQLLTELNNALDDHSSSSIVVLKGQPGIFCSGLDLKEYLCLIKNQDQLYAWATLYMSTLKRFALMPQFLISLVDGKALGGGVGFVAASDLVIATPQSTFKLPEILWGLLPAMIAPFLIRRMGFHPTYFMALSTQTITAAEAHQLHLVDLISQKAEEINFLDEKKLKRVKRCYASLETIPSSLETFAIEESVRHMLDPQVQQNIHHFTTKAK